MNYHERETEVLQILLLHYHWFSVIYDDYSFSCFMDDSARLWWLFLLMIIPSHVLWAIWPDCDVLYISLPVFLTLHIHFASHLFNCGYVGFCAVNYPVQSINMIVREGINPRIGQIHKWSTNITYGIGSADVWLDTFYQIKHIPTSLKLFLPN